MALSSTDKLNIAKKLAEGKKPHTIAKELGLNRSSVEYAISHDKELIKISGEIRVQLGDIKKREADEAITSLKELYEKRLDSLISTWCELVALPKELIDVTSTRDRVGAANLILEMVDHLARYASEEEADETAASIEIIVEDASQDE